MGAGRAEDREGAARGEGGQDAGGELAAAHAPTAERTQRRRRGVRGTRAHEGGAALFFAGVGVVAAAPPNHSMVCSRGAPRGFPADHALAYEVTAADRDLREVAGARRGSNKPCYGLPAGR